MFGFEDGCEMCLFRNQRPFGECVHCRRIAVDNFVLDDRIVELNSLHVFGHGKVK